MRILEDDWGENDGVYDDRTKIYVIEVEE